MNRNLLYIIIIISLCSGILFLSGCTSMNTITGKDVTTITIPTPGGLTVGIAEGDCRPFLDEELVFEWAPADDFMLGCHNGPNGFNTELVYFLHEVQGYRISILQRYDPFNGTYIIESNRKSIILVDGRSTTRATISIRDINEIMKANPNLPHFLENGETYYFILEPFSHYHETSTTYEMGNITMKENLCTNISLYARANPVGKISQ